MKAVSVVLHSSVARNLTNEELVRHIEFEFGNLSGSLLLMFERFKDLVGIETTLNAQDTAEDIKDIVVICPKCGTELELEITETVE